MAAIPAIITVNFTSNYAGPHRICWRIGSVGPYDCTTIVVCAGGGSPCSGNINVMVDNETCDPVTFEGYVQAACEDINSTQGRVPFSEVFTPTPSCLRYEVTCDNVPVASITVTGGGDGYDPMNPPAVSFTGGGGGAGATATAVVGDGAVTGDTLTNPGAGYTNGAFGAVPMLGGSGTGALASVTIAGGMVTAVIFTTPGSGYQDGDILSPDTAVVGVPSITSTTSVTSDYGEVISITLNTPGSGYTVAPGVVVDPPVVGTQATAVAVMEDCPDVEGTNCDGTASGIFVMGFQLAETVAFCSPGVTPVVPVPAQFNIVQDDNCLCDCEVVSVTNTNSAQSGINIRLTYVPCGGNITTLILPPQTSSPAVCVATGSMHVSSNNPAATWTINSGGACQGA